MLPRIFQPARRLFRLSNSVPGATLTRVEAAENRLRPITKQMERRFLGCGAALEDLTAGSEALALNSAELVRLATGQEEASQAVRDAMAALSQPVAHLDRHAAQLEERGAALAEARAILGKVLNHESDLQSAVAPLRATRTMFRVEASRLDEADQAAFVDLADQIETLHDQVRGVFAEEFTRLSETRATLTAVCARVHAESARQAEELAREKAQIGDALAALNLQIESNEQHQAHLNAGAASVAQAVSRVVVALQSQDIIAQITQHLFEGIERIRNIGRGDPPRLHALVEMQKSRVSGAIDQLDGSSAATGSAANDVLAAIGQTPDESLEREFCEVALSANGAIQVLLEIADKVRGMSGAAFALGQDTLRQIEPLNQVTTQLSDRVDRLSHQMNLVALNAQIQAVRIDAGTGLEVLASHTAGVATEAARLGQSIREGLERFQQIVQLEVNALADTNRMAGLQQAHLDGDVRTQEQRLAGLRQTIDAHLERMRAEMATVRQAARKVAQCSQPEREEEQGFAEMRDALENLAGRLSELPGSSRDKVLKYMEEDDHHAIAAERINHLKIAGALGGPLNDGPAESTAQDGQVELF